MINRALLALAVLTSLGGCCSTHRGEKALSEHATPPQGNRIAGQGGAAIKRNAAEIVAVVDSVQGVDDMNYRLFVRLSSASGVEGMDSPASAGQSITLVPDYATDNQGNVDPSNARNKRLMSLHSAGKGDQIRGTISLLSKGWVLVDARKP